MIVPSTSPDGTIMRLLLVVSVFWMPAAVMAMPAFPATPASPTNAFSGYQPWSEPGVRGWQETNAQLMGEPSGHAGHSMGTSPTPQEVSPEPATSGTPDMPHEGEHP